MELLGALRAAIGLQPPVDEAPRGERKRGLPEEFLGQEPPSSKARLSKSIRSLFVDLNLKSLPVNSSGYGGLAKGASTKEVAELEKLLREGYELVAWDGE